ncbi:MAG: hypothetical protein OXM02_00060 [Bacteroidota bacterium]|nr:hypothetical protein [Bacteroidota bacterium]MDE2832897.1 hypothetical protein [Bacteroidota bacterium]MDE2956128.1 hypothetical protein [Bacteroidota bacterium]
MRYLLTAVLVLGLFAACEDSVSPILESDRQFTIFGALDMDLDTQYVRVIPIRPQLESTSDSLNVTVRTIESETGHVQLWRDSVHVFDTGLIGHIFHAPMRIRAGFTYRLEVTPIGGDVVTSAETTVPAAPGVTVFPETVELVFTTRLLARQRVVWEGLEQAPFDLEQWYRFVSLSDYSYRDILLSYDPVNRAVQDEPGQWEVDMDLVRDRDSLATKTEIGPSAPLAGLGLRITLLDSDFIPPGEDFDRDVLAQPGTLSNVENGFGFFGSVGRFSTEWLLADTTVRALGMTPLGRGTLPGSVREHSPGMSAPADQ